MLFSPWVIGCRRGGALAKKRRFITGDEEGCQASAGADQGSISEKRLGIGRYTM
jgi:hypothetical protein